jgi:hypothetical protein
MSSSERHAGGPTVTPRGARTSGAPLRGSRRAMAFPLLWRRAPLSRRLLGPTLLAARANADRAYDPRAAGRAPSAGGARRPPRRAPRLHQSCPARAAGRRPAQPGRDGPPRHPPGRRALLAASPGCPGTAPPSIPSRARPRRGQPGSCFSSWRRCSGSRQRRSRTSSRWSGPASPGGSPRSPPGFAMGARAGGPASSPDLPVVMHRMLCPLGRANRHRHRGVAERRLTDSWARSFRVRSETSHDGDCLGGLGPSIATSAPIDMTN